MDTETDRQERRPATVAILAVRESMASVVFGMYDTFVSAGRDWRLTLEGNATPGHDGNPSLQRSGCYNIY